MTMTSEQRGSWQAQPPGQLLPAHAPDASVREGVFATSRLLTAALRTRRYTAAGDEWTESTRCSRDYLKKLGSRFSPQSLEKPESNTLPSAFPLLTHSTHSAARL